MIKGNLTTRETFSLPDAIPICQGTNSYFLGNVGVGKSSTVKTALEVLGTISGSTLYATGNMLSSGSLVVQSTGMIKGNLTTRGTFSGAALTVMGQGTNSYFLGN